MSSGSAVRSPSFNDATVIRILIVDDHPLLRDGVEALINVQSDMRLIAQASNGREGIEQFLLHRPDITLMDMQMPEKSGLEALLAIREKAADARVIILTTHSGDVHTRRAMEAGAKAYLLKTLVHRELLDTIRAVHAGRKTMSPAVAAELAEHSTADLLTPREVDVLRLIAMGCANKEIGARLGTTEDTIKSRVKNIIGKLGAEDRTHAVMIGLRRGIITL